MAVRKIESSDTLELGFRGKYNETIEEIVVSGVLTSAGKLRLIRFNGNGYFEIDLTGPFYTKTQIDELFDNVGNSIPNASESQRGIIQIATMDEVDAGEDDQKAITPLKAADSTLFPFKGEWIAPVDDAIYRKDSVVIYGAGIYLALSDNNVTPDSDSSKWRRIGGNDPRPSIPVSATAQMLINNWQTDTLPASSKTYAEVFGNTIFKALVVGEDDTGFHVPFEANVKYTTDPGNGNINQVLIENILYSGELTFI
ncbi:hypothetical protein [Pedobacter zeae]|uniref:Uncharacterized protein n=1 Tax=Pedobacter zeae TaxID=1737356 RepID=A0A7W6P6B2_9SPHI|nr:hypothetical protein [Pedobacter zeae]MBB4107754.1 hypothetical protein [Pedobacter zeae]GGG97259.1 hypothetical protein GCM10007422_09000 [Pedobacter zeae]